MRVTMHGFALAAFAALAVVLLGGIARANGPTGYDHVAHDKKLPDGRTLSCSNCHLEQRGKLVGRPGHAACFGACHGAPPTTQKPGKGVAPAKVVFGDRAAVCTTCHAPGLEGTTLGASSMVSYPPYALAPDFVAAFGHKRHAAVACTQCHDSKSAASTSKTPHDRCVSCHDGSAASGRGPAMSKCASCHVVTPPAAANGAQDARLPVAFSHARHGSRSAAGKNCTQCHRDITANDAVVVPPPTMSSCGTAACHDGKAAFATTAACTRCHDKAPVRFEVSRPTKRFLHAGAHTDVIETQPCTSCHALGPRGDTIVAGHSTCAGAACHAADFGAREPMICGACHNATEPWRPLVADRGPADRTEFGAMLDHDKHKTDCTHCHSLRTPSAQLRPPRGHAACTGAGCHAEKGGSTPQLGACNACHRAGLAAEREATRLGAPWSVRARFDHRTHATQPDQRPLSCTSCHSNLPGTDLVKLATPTKASCAPCHDANKSAFKLTGTSCGRCHLEKR
jgi:c(7)-type cytochrome triheme protein